MKSNSAVEKIGASTGSDDGAALAGHAAAGSGEGKQRWKLHLEDHEQDFLWFIVEGDTVIEAGPFQNWFWAGKKFQQPKRWQRGSRIVWTDGRVLKYPVARAVAMIGAA